MRKVSSALIIGVLLAPSAALAFPFGGRASVVLNCVYNSTIYTNLGPPRGGEFIWTTGTKTYQFGPPSHAGQWMLGLAGAPYYCIYKISPLTIYTGIAITMMGSSGPGSPPAPATTGPTPSSPSPTPSSTGTTPAPTPTPPSGGGAVLISEIYYSVDSAHGVKPDNEWVEIYNGTDATVNIGGWRLEDSLSFDVIPAGTSIAPGKFLVVVANASTKDKWSLGVDQFVALSSPIGDGLSNAGDRVVLRNASGAIVDAISWGTNKSVLDPAAAPVSYGQSLARVPHTRDTNSASDLSPRTPSPGR